MKLQFKHQAYQADAVRAVMDCFQGQPKSRGLKYAIDPGATSPKGFVPLPGTEAEGFANAAIAVAPADILKSLQEIQRGQGIGVSDSLKVTEVSKLNLDIEMETGTGKTYCYIKTMFELYKAFGWSKFIVVVPSIAIREGVAKSFEVMAEHFLEQYGKRARWFIYNSKQLHQLESFSSDAGINVMIINVQAFATRGEDARRIYLELDDFQSRKPIDVIRKNRPILILDEPQKMEGAAAVTKLKEFDPLMILRYSATHRTEHNKVYFKGKVFKTDQGEVEVTAKVAKQIEFYLIQNGYVDFDHHITATYHEAKGKGERAKLPPELAPYQDQVFALIDTVFSDADIPQPDNEFAFQPNRLNGNFQKKEFQELWQRINRKAVYSVRFDSEELISKSIAALDKELIIAPLQYVVTSGEQKDETSFDELKQGEGFVVRETATEKLATSAQSVVKYDLIGKIAGATVLTRRTASRILTGISPAVFGQYKRNPEDFILKAARLINEQKATMIVEHITYDATSGVHEVQEIFTEPKADLTKGFKAKNHIYEYVFTDSTVERTFVGELDASAEVVVYAKLPKTFFIPTPVGNYNPDWAIAFKQDKVKHVYFVAETKGDLSSLQLRKIEESKIACARKFFARITSDQVRYDVVDSYGKLMELVK